MANSVEPAQMPRSAATDLGLHCLSGLSVCLSVPLPQCITAAPSGHTTLKWRHINVDAITLTFVLVTEATFYDQAPRAHYSIMMPSDILDYWSHQVSAKSMKSLWTGDKRTCVL